MTWVENIRSLQQECFKAYFEPLATKKVEYTITDNIVAITVEG